MIKLTSVWDKVFFSDWVNLQNALYANDSEVLAESIDDFDKLLSHPDYFPNDSWIAISVYESEKLLARAMVTVSKLNPTIAKIGFIETIEKKEVFLELWNEVEKQSKALGANYLKGPINFHFFNSYRMKTWGTNRSFYGEPRHKIYYQSYFDSVQMKPIKTWETFRIRFFRSQKQYGEIRQAKKPEHRLHIRSINMARFDDEMRIIHGLFCDTFSQMPEFEPIPLETFKHLYAGFRYIISPLFAFIIEHEGRPVAFCVNFMDPQHVILQHQKLKKWLPEKLLDLWTLIRIKLNFKRLLIMYVGRLPAQDGSEYKGIQSLVAKKMMLPVALSIPELLICYTAEDSPALKSYKEDQKEILAKYVLLGKKLE